MYFYSFGLPHHAKGKIEAGQGGDKVVKPPDQAEVDRIRNRYFIILVILRSSYSPIEISQILIVFLFFWTSTRPCLFNEAL
jgi:hypothetical protein